MASKFCGLFGAHICVSKFNDNGKCPCMKCAGSHCHDCLTYIKYAQQVAMQMNNSDERTKCFLCRTFGTRNR